MIQALEEYKGFPEPKGLKEILGSRGPRVLRDQKGSAVQGGLPGQLGKEVPLEVKGRKALLDLKVPWAHLENKGFKESRGPLGSGDLKVTVVRRAQKEPKVLKALPGPKGWLEHLDLKAPSGCQGNRVHPATRALLVQGGLAALLGLKARSAYQGNRGNKGRRVTWEILGSPVRKVHKVHVV